MSERAHEFALLAVGGAALAALVARCGVSAPVTLGTALGIGLYATARHVLSGSDARARKLRIFATYGYVLWFYWQTTVISRALGTPVRDAELLAVDRWMLGETPALACTRLASPWLTDVMSAAYQTYLIYLHVALILVLRGPVQVAERWAATIFGAFAVGQGLYLLVPALGPGAAFPELCGPPLAGGYATAFNGAVVSNGNSALGTFPSLHVLITLMLLTHDRVHSPERFRLFVLPAFWLIASTVYLRYHYAVDLLAGAAIWAVLAWRLRDAPEVRAS